VGILFREPVITSNSVHKIESFEAIMKVDAYSIYYVAKAVSRYMIRNPPSMFGVEKGVIINIGSVSGIEANNELAGYGASKGAVIGMTLPLARALAKFGIRVVCISPGFVDTDMGGPYEPAALAYYEFVI
jgi:NAD(P)-dependent dehydrogenase (short-subunit alcohol dehydrogenase family)